MKILYIDDENLPVRWYDSQNSIEIRKTYDEAVQALNEQRFEIVDIKLDLHQILTGCDLIRYIIRENIMIPSIYIHADDVNMRNNMLKLLKNFTKSEIQFY